MTAAADWNNCTERDQPDAAVWRLTDSIPMREWRLTSFDCRTQSGWGATDPHWIGDDTIELTRHDAATTTTIRAIYDGRIWKAANR